MPTFAYTARTRTGGQKKGTITADSRQAATVMLTQQGLKIENITERAARGANTAKLNRKVKTADLLVFTRQLSTIVSAGLPLMQGLDILAEQTDDPNFGAIINAISQEVESGETFSDSLRKFPRAFPDLYVSMVRSGEASGDLDGVLIQLADYLESSEELKRRIKSAMTYPVVAFSMIILIASGLIIWVVPQFAEIFNAMSAGKTPLPAPTRILIAVSDFLRSWYGAPLIVVAIIAAWFSVRAYGATEAGRFQLDALKLRMPVFGNLSRKVAISRFTRTLSTLTRSGVAILQALEIVERTAGNEVYAKAIRQAADSVRNGDTLADPLARAEVFPAMVTRMIAVGEKTGALEVMLMKISDFYDSEVRALVDSLTSLIEPILIGLMGVVVGGIVIALFMPILQLSSLVSQ
jgi:type IV pilus assembly protein PilC